MRALALALLAGCAGPVELDDAPVPPDENAATDASTAPAPVTFACDEHTAGEPDALRRLTMQQYRNTLRDLTRWALGDAMEAEVVVALAGVDGLPNDRREPTPSDPHGGYRRLDQAIEQAHVDGALEVASALGAALTTPERLEKLAGSCATDGDARNDAACLADFIRRFGARALRRPLDEDDERFYAVVYGSDVTADPAAYADVITVMLSAPGLLYFVEHGGSAVGHAGRYELTAHELASRLSYHFWQTLPDDALWRAAEDGSLLDPGVLGAHVDRLLADPRARTTMTELFSDWLGLEDVPALDAYAHDPMFAAFAGPDLPDGALRQQVIDEVLDMVAHYTWTEPSGMRALFTSERSFARGERLARLYGVLPWDGVTPPPALPEGERPGLLTRAWFLASGAVTTRPIQRGVAIRRKLLCDDLAPPPANVSALLAAPGAGQTTRERVEELTEQPGTACAACHTLAINPLGFAFEGFDALGRIRDHELLFEPDGTPGGALPIDTRSVPRITPDDLRPSDGPADLAERMLESGKLEACLARNYFRFTFGRLEDPSRDGCALERLRARLAQTDQIRELLREAALLPEMRERTFDP